MDKIFRNLNKSHNISSDKKRVPEEALVLNADGSFVFSDRTLYIGDTVALAVGLGQYEAVVIRPLLRDGHVHLKVTIDGKEKEVCENTVSDSPRLLVRGKLGLKALGG